MNSNLPSRKYVAIVPNDTTDFVDGTCRSIYVGVTGNVVAVINNQAVTFVAAQPGSILPIGAARVNATGTTATNLVALY